MKSTFLSPLDGLFSQVMGNMDNLGGAVQADRRGWVECVGPRVSCQDTGDMLLTCVTCSHSSCSAHHCCSDISVQGTHGLSHHLPRVGSSLRSGSYSGH